MVSFEISGRLPSLNEYTNACRTNWAVGAKMKKDAQMMILPQLPNEKISDKSKVVFVWHLKDRRRDPDNICFAKKFILDAMQTKKMLPNDNHRFVKGFEDIFIVDGKDYVQVIFDEL